MSTVELKKNKFHGWKKQKSKLKSAASDVDRLQRNSKENKNIGPNTNHQHINQLFWPKGNISDVPNIPTSNVNSKPASFHLNEVDYEKSDFFYRGIANLYRLQRDPNVDIELRKMYFCSANLLNNSKELILMRPKIEQN